MNFNELYLSLNVFLPSLPSFLSGVDFFFQFRSVSVYLYYMARRSILSQLFRQSAGYVFVLLLFTP